MKKIFKLLFIAIAALMPAKMTAQQLGGMDSKERYVQSVRIGLVDEFMKRFNGSEVHPDIPRKSRNSRKNNLMMLFDLGKFTSKKDKRFTEASAMMDAAIKHRVRIHYEDSAWCARALCSGSLNGKAVSFYLYLTVESRGKGMYKWVIAKADGRLFSTRPAGGEKLMIMPDDHETNFISLSRIISAQPANIRRLLRKSYTYDATSSFVYLVQSGQLKINHVSNLDFIFTQIPGYEFTVSYIEREKNNLGWLISSFRKESPKEKNAFIESLYGKRKSQQAMKVTEPESIDDGQYIDISQSINSNILADSIKKDSSILSTASILALMQTDSVICMLVDPMSTDTTSKSPYHEKFEVLSQSNLSEEACNALKSTLSYPKSFEDNGYSKDCTFLPDIVFVLYGKGEKKMIVSYSFYCDVCKINSDGNPITYNGEKIRDSILQLSTEAFPNDRYLRRIAGKTR